MRILFALIVILHGLIHFLGFAKAFNYGRFKSLKEPISRPAGLIWLLATFLFLISGILCLFRGPAWWMWALPAMVLSQVVIFLAWKDARFGTIANVIVLAGVILGYASWDFRTMVKKELAAFLPVTSSSQNLLTEDALVSLPPVVQTWIRRAGAVGKPIPQTVHLKQTGQMRTTPGGNWMPVEAEQWFTPMRPGFFWAADVRAAPGFYLVGRDRYSEGKGHMLIKMLSLFPVADAKGPETDQGSMLRYLAETVWFPSGALHESIQWEQLDSSSAKATMNWGGITASGIFRFDAKGDPLSFEAKRYYDREEGATLEDWFIRIEPNGIREFGGIRIPSRSAVSWKLKEGDFNWFNLEITELEYK